MYDITYTMSMRHVHNAWVGCGCVDVAAMASQVYPSLHDERYLSSPIGFDLV